MPLNFFNLPEFSRASLRLLPSDRYKCEDHIRKVHSIETSPYNLFYHKHLVANEDQNSFTCKLCGIDNILIESPITRLTRRRHAHVHFTQETYKDRGFKGGHFSSILGS